MSRTRPSRPKSLGDRLRRRREDFGASLDQIAQWSGVATDRLEGIETGAPIHLSELEAICRSLAVDSGTLARGDDRNPRRSPARFRAAAGVALTPEDLRTLSLVAELGRIGGFLATQVGRRSRLLTLRDPKPVGDRIEPWRQGYQLGEAARRSLFPRSGPIFELEELLTELGVHLARTRFSSPSLDAASLWEEGALPVILINDRSPRSQSSLSRRALLAHELCHLLHDSGDRDLTTQLSWAEGQGNYETRTEQRARAFAPAFLATRDDVRHWFRAGAGRRIREPGRKVEELARRWGFSLRGAIWHAKNCGLIQAPTAESLDRRARSEDHAWAESFERTERQQPTVQKLAARNVSPLAKGLIADLAVEAAAAGVISMGRGREIVSWA